MVPQARKAKVQTPSQRWSASHVACGHGATQGEPEPSKHVRWTGRRRWCCAPARGAIATATRIEATIIT